MSIPIVSYSRRQKNFSFTVWRLKQILDPWMRLCKLAGITFFTAGINISLLRNNQYLWLLVHMNWPHHLHTYTVKCACTHTSTRNSLVDLCVPTILKDAVGRINFTTTVSTSHFYCNMRKKRHFSICRFHVSLIDTAWIDVIPHLVTSNIKAIVSIWIPYYLRSKLSCFYHPYQKNINRSCSKPWA